MPLGNEKNLQLAIIMCKFNKNIVYPLKPDYTDVKSDDEQNFAAKNLKGNKNINSLKHNFHEIACSCILVQINTG